jgi:molybdenum cofactor cytidylyltransferase
VIAGLLLAAGGARRFGSQKLVAPLGGVAIVRRSAAALAEHVDEMIVVVGSEGDRVRDALTGIAAQIVENPDWNDGLSSSLRRGVAALPKGADAVLVALGDQPTPDPRTFATLVARWRTSTCPIVAARYRDGVAPPVLMGRAVFGEIDGLRGDVGARPIIQRDPGRVAFVDIDADAPRDVDTVDDLRALER